MQRSLLFKAAGALAAVWIAVWALSSWAGSRAADPEKIAKMIEANPLDGLDDASKRREAIEKVAGQINRLDFNQRQGMRDMEGREGMRGFFEEMDEDEQMLFVDLTIEQQFRTAMKAFNEMEPEERKKIIGRVQREMERDNSEVGRAEREQLEEIDPEIFNGIVEKGMRAYYQDASAEVKMDLAPLMEEIQGRIQGMRGGPGGR